MTLENSASEAQKWKEEPGFLTSPRIVSSEPLS